MSLAQLAPNADCVVVGSELLALLSPELASRAQFGWTISVHIIFAALSIGLAPFIVYFTWKSVRTGADDSTSPPVRRHSAHSIHLFG